MNMSPEKPEMVMLQRRKYPLREGDCLLLFSTFIEERDGKYVLQLCSGEKIQTSEDDVAWVRFYDIKDGEKAVLQGHEVRVIGTFHDDSRLVVDKLAFVEGDTAQYHSRRTVRLSSLTHLREKNK